MGPRYREWETSVKAHLKIPQNKPIPIPQPELWQMAAELHPQAAAKKIKESLPKVTVNHQIISNADKHNNLTVNADPWLKAVSITIQHYDDFHDICLDRDQVSELAGLLNEWLKTKENIKNDDR